MQSSLSDFLACGYKFVLSNFVFLSPFNFLAQQIAIKAHTQTWPRATVLHTLLWEKVPGHQCSSLQAEKRRHRSIPAAYPLLHLHPSSPPIIGCTLSGQLLCSTSHLG